MSLLESLKWRYATKKMNHQVVPEDKVHRILEAAHLAPTSSGLQPFEVIVIKNKDLKTKIRAISWNQSMVEECSHLLVFAAWDHYTTDRINKMFDHVNTERGFKNEGWENYRKMLLDTYPARDEETNFTHAAKQAYIGFAMSLAAAAEEKVDSTPMEGFDAKQLDSMLNLKAKGLRSVVMLPLGYRETSGDWLVNLKKVRKPFGEFVSTVD